MDMAKRLREVDKCFAHPYSVCVNLTLSVDKQVIAKARRKAEAMGTSVNQLVREYLELFAGTTDRETDAHEFVRISGLANGNSKSWKFNREELHERR